MTKDEISQSLGFIWQAITTDAIQELANLIEKLSLTETASVPPTTIAPVTPPPTATAPVTPPPDATVF